MVHQYSKGRFLGKGGFAKCYEVTDLATKALYAAKIVAKASIAKPRAMAKLKSEIAIHRSLDNDKVVKFYDYFEDNDFVYIILELCPNQTLNDFMRKRPSRRLSEPEALFYFYDLIIGLKYLHRRHVIHRDLKLGNLFLDAEMRIKIGDFGLAAQLEYEGERKRTVCGTPNYIAPEILDGKNGHSYEVDVWSLGVILYTMVVGRPPFETADVKTTYRRIRHNQYSFPEGVPLSDAVKNLIVSILRTEARARPSLDDILASQWMRSFQLPPPVPHSVAAANVMSAPSASPRLWRGTASARSETPDPCGGDFARLDSPAPGQRMPFQDLSPGIVPQLQRGSGAAAVLPPGSKVMMQPPCGAPVTPGRYAPPGAGGPPGRPPLAHWGGNDENAVPMNGNVACPTSPACLQPPPQGCPPMLSCGSAGHLGPVAGSARHVPARAAVCHATLRDSSPFARVTGAPAAAPAPPPSSRSYVPAYSTPRSAAGSPRHQQQPPHPSQQPPLSLASNLAAAYRLAASQTPRTSYRGIAEGWAEPGSSTGSRCGAGPPPASRAESQSDVAAVAGFTAHRPAVLAPCSFIPPLSCDAGSPCSMRGGFSKDNLFSRPCRDSELTDTRAPSSSSFLPPRSSASSARSAVSAASGTTGEAASARRHDCSASTPALPQDGGRELREAGQQAIAAAAAAAAAACAAAAASARGQRTGGAGPLSGRASPAVPSQPPAAVGPAAAPQLPELWVTRWVDYSSKYGVGYMLSDGSVGVYYNDSTKIVLVPDGRRFDYITRRTHDRPEVQSTHNFEDYPEDLKKKVTLLRHFKNYMLTDIIDKKDGATFGESSLQVSQTGQPQPQPAVAAPGQLPYVKKWTRNRQAVMFQLSNKMVQVVFMDKTEALLSSRQHFVTYVDKRGQISSYPLNSSLDVPNEELQRRLQYTKDILASLLGARPDDRVAANGGA